MTKESRFGAYDVHHRLGAGGMGDVYLARHRDLDRTVALKLLRTTGGDSEEAVLRLRREARIASQLSHPGLVKVFDFGDVDGVHYLAMELVAGKTLHDVIQERGPLDVAEALRIAAELLAALSACHEAGLVHRDVKPRNIMIDASGRVRLLDLGLVKPFGRTTYTSAGSLVGTPAYMPPEAFLCPGVELDARGDIYQVGVTLHECLAGVPPFDACELADLILRICSDPPRALPLSGPDAVRARSFLDRALAKAPEMRFESCAAALRALEAGVTQERPARTLALRGREHPAAARASPPGRRARALAGAGALLIAILVAVGAVTRRAPARVESVAPRGPAVHAGAPRAPRSPAQALEAAVETARLEAAKHVADGGAARLVAGRMIATWSCLAQELAAAVRSAPAASGAGSDDARLGSAMMRAFQAWQACDSLLERYLEEHAHDPVEAHARHAEFTRVTAEAAARACAPAAPGGDAGLVPELQAGLACALALTRPAASAAERARLDARVTGLVRRALAQMLSVQHRPPIEPLGVRTSLKAMAMIGARAALLELVTGTRGILETRRPLEPRLVLVELELRAAEIDARTTGSARLAAWSDLLKWFVAAWPHDPRRDPGPGGDRGATASLGALVRTELAMCRDEIASAARAAGTSPPPEPALRPSGKVSP